MKKAFIVLAILLFCSGCYAKDSLGATKLYNVAEVVESALPFGMGQIEGTDFLKLLERDEMGRELYEYRSQYYEHLVIIQQTEYPLVYYYRDLCYISRIIHEEEFTEEDTIWLKEANDWGRELAPDKMAPLNYSEDIPDIEERFELESELYEYFDLDGKNVVVTMDGMERDTSGKQIIRVTVKNPTDTEHSFGAYLILSEYVNSEHIIYACEEIDSGMDCREEIMEFREKYWDK